MKQLNYYFFSVSNETTKVKKNTGYTPDKIFIEYFHTPYSMVLNVYPSFISHSIAIGRAVNILAADFCES